MLYSRFWRGCFKLFQIIVRIENYVQIEKEQKAYGFVLFSIFGKIYFTLCLEIFSFVISWAR